MDNILKRTKEGKVSLGLYVTMNDPSVVELAALAGFDYIRIDLEHALLDSCDLKSLIMAADIYKMPVQVRVPSISDIPRILDFGVSAIVVPDVDSVEVASKAVEMVKYAPVGMRGMAGHARCTGYGTTKMSEYMKTANEDIALIVQIESKEGVSNLEKILALDGIDMVTSGKQDLSQSYGCPGDIKNPQVIEAENYILDTALKCGKVPTMMVGNLSRAQEMISKGIYCLTLGFDQRILFQALKDKISEYNNIR